jgi:hypothetical protein
LCLCDMKLMTEGPASVPLLWVPPRIPLAHARGVPTVDIYYRCNMLVRKG